MGHNPGVDPLVRLQRYIEWLIGHPVAELSRAQRFLRFLVDIARHGARELQANDAAQMAAALTYRTIFGLVPLLMVSMLAFRLFGDMDAAARQLQSAAYAFFNYQVDAYPAGSDGLQGGPRRAALRHHEGGRGPELRGDRRGGGAPPHLGRARAPHLLRERGQPHLPRARAAAAG